MKSRKLIRALCLALLWTLCSAPVALASADSDAPTRLTCFINHNWFPVSSFTGIIPEEITRLTGIALDVTIAKTQQQFNQLIVSGNLPDLIYTSTLQQRLSDPEHCYSYDELLEMYDIDWEIPPELRANALAFSSDGRIYGLLNNYATDEEWRQSSGVPITGSLCVRMDILEALGIREIHTTDELFDVFLRVRDEYPDMVPLTFDSVHRFNIFRSYFGLGLVSFLEQEDGACRYYARDGRCRAMLEYLNRLYGSGCMIADNFATDTAHAGLLYGNGQSFAFSACTQNANLGLHNRLQSLNPEWRSDELRPLDGSCFDAQGLGWSSVFISRTASDPEACIRLVQWMYSEEGQYLTEWGRAGVDYVLDDSGLPVFSGDYLESVNNGTYNAVYNPWFYFGTSAIIEAEGRCALLGDLLPVETYRVIRESYHNHPWIASAIFNLPEAQLNQYNRIETMLTDYENKVILSADDDSFEQNFREMQDYLEDMGIADIEASMDRLIPEYYSHYNE